MAIGPSLPGNLEVGRRCMAALSSNHETVRYIVAAFARLPAMAELGDCDRGIALDGSDTQQGDLFALEAHANRVADAQSQPWKRSRARATALLFMAMNPRRGGLMKLVNPWDGALQQSEDALRQYRESLE